MILDFDTLNIDVHLVAEPEMPFLDGHSPDTPGYVKNWASYIGQESMKSELEIYIQESIQDCTALPHILLDGPPGMGKTELARCIAKESGVHFVMLVPPFSPLALYNAALSLNSGEILFIDEIHRMADGGPRMAENLLHMMEEKKLYLEIGKIDLADITIIGATTDADKLPETIVDRFVIKPYFQPYSTVELIRITKNFCDFYEIVLPGDVMVAIAQACRGVPRIAREFVVAAKAKQRVKGSPITPAELLSFKQVEPNGLTRQHIAYLVALYEFFGRQNKDGQWEYVTGEASLMSVLRESKNGIARLERFLIESGLIGRTPRGRLLTSRGVIAAKNYTKEGK